MCSRSVCPVEGEQGRVSWRRWHLTRNYRTVHSLKRSRSSEWQVWVHRVQRDRRQQGTKIYTSSYWCCNKPHLHPGLQSRTDSRTPCDKKQVTMRSVKMQFFCPCKWRWSFCPHMFSISGQLSGWDGICGGEPMWRADGVFVLPFLLVCYQISSYSLLLAVRASCHKLVP